MAPAVAPMTTPGYPAIEPADRATALASSFAATLELVREGQVEIRQHEPFAPLYMRSAAGNSPVGVHND